MVILISHRGESRTPKATKVEIFVSNVNGCQSLTVVTKNFVLDTTGVLDPCDTLYLSHTLNRLKISPSQCSHQAMYPLCFGCTKQHNNVITELCGELLGCYISDIEQAKFRKCIT